MASATPDLRLPSQPQGITAHWPVPNYTAWSTERSVIIYLPDGVGMFACLGRADVHGTSPTLNEVVHSHVAVVVADGYQIRVFGVDVQRHDAAVRRVDELRERRVLERVEQDHTRRLLQKLVCASDTPKRAYRVAGGM